MTIEIVIGVTASYRVVSLSDILTNNEQNKKIPANCTSPKITFRAGFYRNNFLLFFSIR